MTETRQPSGKYVLTPTEEELAILDRAHKVFGATVLADLVANYVQAWKTSIQQRDKSAVTQKFDADPTKRQNILTAAGITT